MAAVEEVLCQATRCLPRQGDAASSRVTEVPAHSRWSGQVPNLTRSRPTEAALNFTDVAKALRDLAEALGAQCTWLLLDEWVSVPVRVQPYLAEFLLHCVLPLQQFTVKIAAIEQQSEFDVIDPATGSRMGMELGADVVASVDLDAFMVFEQASERACDLFQGLFFKHLTSGIEGVDPVVPNLTRPT